MFTLGQSKLTSKEKTMEIDNKVLATLVYALMEDNGSEAKASVSNVGTMPNRTGEIVLIRTVNSGVHYGELIARDGDEVSLRNARRLWQWNGAFTLSAVATKGVKVQDSKFSTHTDIDLLGVIEIIPVTDLALSSLNSVPDHG
jgi:hypothetical protein